MLTEEQIKVLRASWNDLLFCENVSPENIRDDVVFYLDTISTLQQQNKQLKEALEEIKDEK